MTDSEQKRDLSADREAIISGKFASVSTRKALEYLNRADKSENHIIDLEEALYNIENIVTTLNVEPYQREVKKHLLKKIREALALGSSYRPPVNEAEAYGNDCVGGRCEV